MVASQDQCWLHLKINVHTALSLPAALISSGDQANNMSSVPQVPRCVFHYSLVRFNPPTVLEPQCFGENHLNFTMVHHLIK